MTREEKLYTLKGEELIRVADGLGVKVACNKTRTALKEAKAKVIDRILAAEAVEGPADADVAETVEEPADVVETVEVIAEEPADAEEPAEEPAAPKKERKPRKKKENSADVEKLLSYILEVWPGIVREPEKDGYKFKALCTEGGRQVVKLMWTATTVSLFVRIDPEGLVRNFKTINYGMPFQCMFTDFEKGKAEIDKLFQTALELDSVRKKKAKKNK